MGSNYEENITVSEGCDWDLPRGQRLVMHPSGDTVVIENEGLKALSLCLQELSVR